MIITFCIPQGRQGMSRQLRGWAFVVLVVLLNTLTGCVGPHKYSCAPPTGPCEWGGIYPTVLTPFCEHGIDIQSLECQIHHELAGGVQGLLVLGTIGEGQYVGMEERAQVIGTAVRVAGGKVPVIAGIHCGDVDAARQQVLQAKELGAAAVLVKYTGHPCAGGAEVFGFIYALAELHALPIFYYHYPSQTGLKLCPQEIADILNVPGVVGIKESTLNLRDVQAHIQLTCGQGKAFLSGSALNLTQFLALGGHGAMCAEGVLLPGPTVRAYHAYLDGHHDEARAIQKQLFVMMPILKDRSPPTPIARTMFLTAADHKLPLPMGKDHPQARMKAALNYLACPTSPAVMCPLPQLTAKDQRHVAKAVQKIKCIDWDALCLQVPPVPLSACPQDKDQGMLLKTGAIQLGPGVGRDLLRSQGDGEWGF
jgi:4-hydroxy-tetrahydrodipicolinate synthase